MKLKRIGIVGCGAIGSRIARALVKDFAGQAKLAALYDIDLAKAKILAAGLKKKNIIAGSLDDLIKRSDFVVEAASAKISADVARRAILKSRDCLVMSVGGLLPAPDLFKLAEKNNRFLYIPSGAICGIDGIKAHKLAGIKKVRLTTRKPPKALIGAPYVLKNKINLSGIKKETVIFEGSVQEAIEGFPQNINVAAVLSLSGAGAGKALVRIVSSPDYKGNIHEIEVESLAGKAFIRCENYPSPDNPRTSYLAVLSAIASLKQAFSPVKIGT